ncbi:MAG: hypothetical protein P0S96_02860 [Simkaniaceae bacterium]|nr:hypothetical protein [Candidatus Sacchlamyda saccharinae]
MIIAFRSRFSLEQIFFWSQLALGVAGVFVVCFFFVGMAKRDVFDVGQRGGEVDFYALEKVLSGPLALKESGKSALAVALEQKLVFLAQSVRPDRVDEERVFRIGVKGDGAEQVVREGEAIACNLVESDGRIESLGFGEGDVKMVPHVLDGRSLLLNVERASGAAMEVILKAASPEVKGGDALASGKWLGPDLFFREYGGSEFRPLGLKQQVEVGKDVLYLGEGDFLSFRDGSWVNVGRLENADSDAPLAQVLRVGNDLELEAWDVDGFPLFFARLGLERKGGLRFMPDQVFSGAKLRTTSQVSCKMGKKRFVLSAGDWILQVKEGWRKIRSAEEIQAFLDHEVRGLLVVVDRVDPSGRVSGKVFNEMRTELQPFVFQAVTSKGNRKK